MKHEFPGVFLARRDNRVLASIGMYNPDGQFVQKVDTWLEGSLFPQEWVMGQCFTLFQEDSKVWTEPRERTFMFP